MNTKLKEINNIITLCDSMIDYIHKNGIIHTGNATYEAYKEYIKDFFRPRSDFPRDYGPFLVLDKLHFSSGNYTVCLSEAQMIRNAVVWMKHDLFPDCYEKIFISHREKDERQVAAFMELLYALGIPRPTEDNPESAIFCTSHPATCIENGKPNLDEIKRQLNSHEHMFYIMWYTDSYFESQACLNEAGAIWSMNKKYQEILSPNLKSDRIGGLLDKQPVWFRSNDKNRLNTFKKQIETMFDLPSLTTNAWETARDSYISQINSIVGGDNHADA